LWARTSAGGLAATEGVDFGVETCAREQPGWHIAMQQRKRQSRCISHGDCKSPPFENFRAKGMTARWITRH